MLTIKDGKFYLNEKEFKLYSGAIHYFRVHPNYWRDRLLKLKAMGLNVVETYVAWNMHEKKEGEFTFEGFADLRKFLLVAKEVGLYAIVRPGPYICAEWDFGGLPAWLLKYEDIKLRCYDEKYMFYVKRYLERLFLEIGDLQHSKGGNVIAMQVENEYGSYGRDKKYLSALKKIYRGAGIECLLFTSDGDSRNCLSGGRVEEELMVANFGSHPKKRFTDLKEMQPNKPLVCGEFWCGWFSYFGGKYNGGSTPTQVASYLKEFIELGAGFNFYMFHGGTNFGFTAGANCYEHFEPDVTSYDYGAPLTEWGEYTEKYHKCREVLVKAQGLEKEELPPSPVLKAYDSVKLTKVGGLKDNLEKVGTRHHSNIPYPMEYYGQNQGYVLYKTEISGSYSNTNLTIEGIHDVAYVYLNGEFKGKFNRLDVNYYKGERDELTIPISAFEGTINVEVFVEALGRVNYGEKLYDRKGITGVRIAGQRVYDFEVITFPMEDLSAVAYEEKAPSSYPAFLKGEFEIEEKCDTFLDMNGFSKGCVFLNGFNLGRYWNVGPERTLYIPKYLLKERNEIVVFELEKAYVDAVAFSDKPVHASFMEEGKKNGGLLAKLFRK